ncbi:MAG: aminomethyl-transferring glycine dehydrogenase [Dehalococcoidia bacterium]|nr:aminomethyl-transferring glycine dehydrogenase [Dehalococcoidia bacterium]
MNQLEELFSDRHIGSNQLEIDDMLNYLGYEEIDDLIKDALPSAIYDQQEYDDKFFSEYEVHTVLKEIASKNKIFKNYIGMGYNDSILPAVIKRNVLEDPGWYTAYTPYQPEISQGRLEALLNFQHLIVDLTDLDIANASLLDEATAAAEAMQIMYRSDKNDRNALLISKYCHPQTIAVVEVRAKSLGLDLVIGDLNDFNGDVFFGAIVQNPDTLGRIHDFSDFINKVHESNALVSMSVDILSLVMLKTPGEMDADIAFGSAQRFGVPLGYGGPHAAFISTRQEFKRLLPGRLVGLSVDELGKPALRLALQTREQHIRREKATSNICTAQVLLAVIAGFYAVYHGPKGLNRIAKKVNFMTYLTMKNLSKHGYQIINENFFDTLTIFTNDKTDIIMHRAEEHEVNLRKINDLQIGVSLDETTNIQDVNLLIEIFSEQSVDIVMDKFINQDYYFDKSLTRETKFLDHPTFHKYHSETEMMRYLNRLKKKDIALDQSMIALGSCTMKLNSASSMIPISWPEFANLHPFAPTHQSVGYQEVIGDLSEMLTELTGFDSVSFQPNAGSQGEYAGLLVINKWHHENNSLNRKVCLIPSSAHGTNPASAKMAGLDVVIVACDQDGNIDIDDLSQKAEEYKNNLACLMITYPSTHGVFESTIKEICEIIHNNGGLVYMDGANLNALVGICKPGNIGPDVAHFNLHKTFSIPHGGGGPGVGPIGVVKELSHLLPNHPVIKHAGPDSGIGPVAAAPWGSASILVISWVYMKMMGYKKLQLATKIAILNANYIAKKLEPHFKILYKGLNELVAHECIVDLRVFQESSSVNAEDIAKRLIDYGFHAPTMSWPVTNTFMIEPTESESKTEIDRFCDAMINISNEIKKIVDGTWLIDDNPIIHAPHTAEMALALEWKHCYSREEAAFPLASIRSNKYWAPVSRINNAFGDKNLFCSCPPIESLVS